MRTWTGYRAGFEGLTIARAAATAAAVAAMVAIAVPASAQPARSSGSAPVQPAQFAAVSCVSTKWCLAVGSFTGKSNAKHSLAAVWHAGRWQTIDGTPGTGLATVTCASVWHCVATGLTGPRFEITRVAFDVNGEPPWLSMKPPERPTSPPSCVSLTDCMAVGSVGNEAQGRVVETWSGQTWKAQRAKTTVCTADGTPCNLSDVSCASPASPASASPASVNVLAVGAAQDNASGGVRPEAVAWNGSTWTHTQPPAGSTPPSMDTAVSCTGAFCLVIGSAAAGSGNQVLLASYNATTAQWQNQPVGQPVPTSCGQNCFPPGSLSCGSPVNCLEISGYGNLAWNGSALRRVPSISAGRGSLLGTASCGLNYCLAVGHKTVKGKIRPLAELWNGSTWQIIKTP